MKILITGGTGFIGQALYRRLENDGDHLTVFSRQPHKARQILGKKVNAVSSFEALSDQQFDGVINLAGAPIADRRWSIARKKILQQSRIDFTRQLVQYINARPQKPAVLISGSAVGFYGDQGPTLVNEDTMPHPDYAHDLCLRWEKAARGIAPETRLCLLRTGLVLGAGGGVLSRMLPFFKLGLGGRLGNGQQWMPWIHRQDLVSLIVFLLRHDTLQGVFNGVAPHPVSNAEFARALASVLHRPAFFHQPAWLLRLLFGEMAELLLGGQRAIPERALMAGFSFRFVELDAALRDIFP